MEGLRIMGKLLVARPILSHEFMRPSRLADLLSREELRHDWLDIEHWRSVNCIEFGNEQFDAFDTDNTADRATDSIGTVLSALREDTDGWPGCVIPRTPSASSNLR